VSVAIKKLDGVESVNVSLEKASADIRLKPDNRITLPQLRQIIKNNGYPTKDAQVTARGRIVEQNGTRVLDLFNGTVLEHTDKPKIASDRTVEVTGVSRLRGKGAEQLTATAIK
jgi:copper chaperone CopZ